MEASRDLQSALAMRDATATQAAVARLGFVACDLADPFLTGSALDDADAARALFSDTIDPAELAVLDAPARVPGANAVEDGETLARTSATLTAQAEAAAERGDLDGLRRLRAERLAQALGLARGIAQQAASAIGTGPGDFHAWPNPTRGAMTLRFALPASSAARIEILDIAGRRVAARELGPRPPGTQTLVLDGGLLHALRPGTYLVRVRAGDFTTSGRVALIRG